MAFGPLPGGPVIRLGLRRRHGPRDQTPAHGETTYPTLTCGHAPSKLAAACPAVCRAASVHSSSPGLRGRPSATITARQMDQSCAPLMHGPRRDQLSSLSPARLRTRRPAGDPSPLRNYAGTSRPGQLSGPSESPVAPRTVPRGPRHRWACPRINHLWLLPRIVGGGGRRGEAGRGWNGS